nr:MAG TPA: hypothetical protein [Caudoviricetes sp.]
MSITKNRSFPAVSLSYMITSTLVLDIHKTPS